MKGRECGGVLYNGVKFFLESVDKFSEKSRFWRSFLGLTIRGMLRKKVSLANDVERVVRFLSLSWMRAFVLWRIPLLPS